MGVTDFLYINGAIVFGLVLFMLSRRPRRRWSPIRERRISKSSQDKGSSDRHLAPREGEVHAERSLNVMFMYNGHNFDAFEVLGLPAGSSMEQVNQAYKKGIELTSDAAEQSLLQLAFESIQNSQ